jgi:hypothetical protein
VGRGHYRKIGLCREPHLLPRAKCRALGKETICQEPLSAKKHRRETSYLPWARISAKNNSRRNGSLPTAPRSANKPSWQRADVVTSPSGVSSLPRPPHPASRQRDILYFMCSCSSSPHSHQINYFFFHALQTFISIHILHVVLNIKFFCIFVIIFYN